MTPRLLFRLWMLASIAWPVIARLYLLKGELTAGLYFAMAAPFVQGWLVWHVSRRIVRSFRSVSGPNTCTYVGGPPEEDRCAAYESYEQFTHNADGD